MRARTKDGSTVILVLVFTAVFITLTSSLAGYLFQQQRLHLSKENRERGVQIAEAGLDYYKWFLSHYPDDVTDGTGASGPYIHEYDDPEGGTMGYFSLDIEGNELCDEVSSVDIESTGWSVNDPSTRRTVYGRYARPSVAEYAYILNSNVWAGADRVIIGPYHSNGGIRMDGDNRSTVTSGISTWLCTSSFGCNPSGNQSGVFGTGDHPELWNFPVPPMDFQGITTDLVAIRAIAQTQGIFLAQPTPTQTAWHNNQRGYRLVFQADGTVTVYRVTATNSVWGYNNSNNQTVDMGYIREYDVITTQTSSGTGLGNRAIPSACKVIFVEGKVWIEGTVSGKVTVVSANLTQSNVDHDVVINNNLTYATSDGTSGLTVIAERDVRIPLLSPTNLTLNGIFIAQGGRFGRNHYVTSGTYEVPSAYDSYVQQDTLTLTGTIVSNGREGTKWTNGSGTFVSGYNQRNNSYDRNLATNPPPLTPFVSQDYRFIEWRED